MTHPDDLVNDAAKSDDPLRALCLLLAADMVEMAIDACADGGSADAISEHLEAVISAAERRLVVEPVLINWRAYEPTIQ
jgi:hypothetical protein